MFSKSFFFHVLIQARTNIGKSRDTIEPLGKMIEKFLNKWLTNNNYLTNIWWINRGDIV